MSKTYFSELHATTDTRFWINNPSLAEMDAALAEGAFACTTNPAYCAKLLKSDKAALDAMIDGLIDGHFADGRTEFDFEEMAAAVYREAAKALMLRMLPVYTATNGSAGFVTMQDDPSYDADTEHTVANILKNRKLAPNYMAKIPVIRGGIEAIEECVRLNIPICATEVFAVSQALYMCEAYEKACAKYGNRPVMYLTHISGIFDEYLGKYAKRMGIEIEESVLKQAGVAVAHKQYAKLKEAGFNITMLGGGARGLHHFTGLVGGPHITINWSTAVELLEGDIPVKSVIDESADEAVIAELRAKLDAFRKAYDDDGLTLDEFADYGPVQLFRNSFLNGWFTLQAEIAARRNARAL